MACLSLRKTRRFSALDRARLVILPGCGLQLDDYRDFAAATGARLLGVDLWPTDVAGLRAIGAPGSASWDAWLEATVARCRRTLPLDDPGVAVFAHSAGSIVARELGVGYVGYGCRPGTGERVRLVGTADTLIQQKDGATPVPGAGHYSVVSAEAAARGAAVSAALGMPPFAEPYVDAQAEVGRRVRALLKGWASPVEN